jgi:hypothetical protein
MTQHKILFPDTNVFLQCKALNELQWGDIIVADEIELLVGAPVQDEIDHLKSDGNQRRARRARDANRLFRSVLVSAGESLVIREADPRITLRFAPPLHPKRETAETLDLARADDRLIDEVVNFRRIEPSAEIMSNDTGMILRCRRHGVPLVVIPESWLLPPEKDERDKQIDALRSEVSRLRSTDALLSVSLVGEDGRVRNEVSESMPLYSTLSEEEVTRLIDEIRERYPKTSDFGEPPSLRAELNKLGLGATALQHSWRAPTQERITQYHQEYDEWIGKAREKMENLSSLLNAKHRIRKLQISLSNTGHCPADQVLLELAINGNATVCVTTSDEIPDLLQGIAKFPTTVILPEPPTAPSGGLQLFDPHGARGSLFGEGGLATALRMPDYSHIRPAMFTRDRHEFYRREDDDKPAPTASFTCEELRHQRAPQIFDLWLIASPQDDLKLRLHVRVSARNMSAPVDRHVPIDVQSVPHSTYEAAAKWHVKKYVPTFKL